MPYRIVPLRERERVCACVRVHALLKQHHNTDCSQLTSWDNHWKIWLVKLSISRNISCFANSYVPKLWSHHKLQWTKKKKWQFGLQKCVLNLLAATSTCTIPFGDTLYNLSTRWWYLQQLEAIYCTTHRYHLQTV